MPNDDLAAFSHRMVRIVVDPREWIGKHCNGFTK